MIFPEAKRVEMALTSMLSKVFSPEELSTLAWERKFIQRSSNKLEAIDFVELMTVDMLEDGAVTLEGMCDILRQKHPQSDVTPQALSARINTEQAVEFLLRVLEVAIEQKLQPLRASLDIAVLEGFNRVLLQDSTQCSLHEQLAEAFKGSGGTASSSSLKIDLIYNYTHQLIEAVTLTEGTTPDQKLASCMRQELQPNDLVIRDLGYFALDPLQEIATQQAFYLSRLDPKVKVYLDPEGDAVALGEYLSEHYPDQSVIDLDVYIGQARLPCRLIAYRLPQELVNRRRQKAYATARKKDRTPSKAYLANLTFACYITNVGRDVWNPEVVATIYRLRWQIELTFKNWKSLAHIHVLKGKRPERIRCLVYGRLITILLLNRIYAYAAWLAQTTLHREVSEHKLIRWMKRRNRLAHAIHTESFPALLLQLKERLRTCCKQKRKRNTTRQQLQQQTPYLDTLNSSQAKHAA